VSKLSISASSFVMLVDGTVPSVTPGRSTTMEYAVLIYGDESAWLNADEATQKEMYAAHDEFARQCAERGHKITGGLELRSTASAKTVRGTAESVSVTDGPFAETAEQLGGFYLVATDDLDDLVKAVGLISFGEPVEIRPAVASDERP
jgi:hypothetical protein